MADRRHTQAVATAESWNQGNIAGLDDAMTRRLVASTVLTESAGGNLTITNKQGYVGRYQAGAAWLAEAGYVDATKLHDAMQGYKSEWAWAKSGGMTRFLENSDNWKNGLSLEQYKGSADLQDAAFKTNSDKAYRHAVKDGLLHEGDDPAKIAGFMKANHLGGYGGATAVLTGGRVHRDSNGTSPYDYLHDITRNRDGLDQLIGRERRQGQTQPDKPAPADGRSQEVPAGALKQGAHGAEVETLQRSLAALGYTGKDGKPLAADKAFGANTDHALREFQQAHGIKMDGKAGPETQRTLAQAQQHPLVSEATHPAHGLYVAIGAKLPPGTSPQVTANVTMSAVENGITSADKLKSVDLAGNMAFLRGTNEANRAHIDLQAPGPSLQQSSEYLQSHANKPQVVAPLPAQAQTVSV